MLGHRGLEAISSEERLGKGEKSSCLPWWLAFDGDFEMPNRVDILQASHLADIVSPTSL